MKHLVIRLAWIYVAVIHLVWASFVSGANVHVTPDNNNQTVQAAKGDVIVFDFRAWAPAYDQKVLSQLATYRPFPKFNTVAEGKSDLTVTRWHGGTFKVTVQVSAPKPPAKPPDKPKMPPAKSKPC